MPALPFLTALVFSTGRQGDLISRLRGGKIVLVDQRARRPAAFGPCVEWVCDVEERERFALARPLRLASDWPRVPMNGEGPFISPQDRLPGGRLRPAPPVQGLSDTDDPRAAEVAARLRQEGKVVNGRYVPFDLWSALGNEFGPPTVTSEGDNRIVATWATPWGLFTARPDRTCFIQPPWAWTGALREEDACLLAEQGFKEFRRWVTVAEQGRGPMNPAPEAARAWCDQFLPDPATCDLTGNRAPELLARLQAMYDAGQICCARVWTYREDDGGEGPGDFVMSGDAYGVADLGPVLPRYPGYDPALRIRGQGVGFAAARYAEAGRDDILAALLIGHALGDTTAMAMSESAVGVLMTRARDLLPPRLSRREDHPRWSDIPRLQQQREELLSAWRAADRDVVRWVKTYPDASTSIDLPPSAPAYPVDRIFDPAPWAGLEEDIQRARQGLQAAQLFLSLRPENPPRAEPSIADVLPSAVSSPAFNIAPASSPSSRPSPPASADAVAALRRLWNKR
jgi:hypothetical protein